MRIERLPVDPTTVDVLGNRVASGDPAWTGLVWERAEMRNRAKISVPWYHPDDPKHPDFECIYSVYPLAEPGKRWKNKVVKDVWFERTGPGWVVVHEYEPNG